MKDILDLHTHTIMSGHAYNTLFEMLHAASEKGVKLLGSTEHGPGMPGTCDEYYFLNLRVIPREIYGVKLLMGCELNIIDYDGTVQMKERNLKKLDFAIASLHVPCFESGTVEQNTAAYLGAMKNPCINIIGHPDDGRFPIDYEKLVLGAKEHHVLLEVNSSSLHPGSSRIGARENYQEMLKYCRQYEVPIIINSDAHCQFDVGNHERAIALLEELHFPEELIVNSSIEKAAEFIPALRQEIYTGGTKA